MLPCIDSLNRNSQHISKVCYWPFPAMLQFILGTVIRIDCSGPYNNRVRYGRLNRDLKTLKRRIARKMEIAARLI